MYDSLDHDAKPHQDLGGFMPVYVFAQAIGLITLILTGYWMQQWGGYNWNQNDIVFNYHPLFMIIGLVYLYGDAIVMYRVCRMYPKWPVKVAHACFNFGSLFFAIVGVSAAFSSHNRQEIPNLYSLHSWIGLVTILLFVCQWVMSFLVFLYPGGSDALRARLMPVHKYLGLLLFFMSLVSCISGITEKNVFSKQYAEREPREVVGNFVGFFIMLFGGLIFYLAHNEEYRRLEMSPSQEPIIAARSR